MSAFLPPTLFFIILLEEKGEKELWVWWRGEGGLGEVEEQKLQLGCNTCKKEKNSRSSHFKLFH